MLMRENESYVLFYDCLYNGYTKIIFDKHAFN